MTHAPHLSTAIDEHGPHLSTLSIRELIGTLAGIEDRLRHAPTLVVLEATSAGESKEKIGSSMAARASGFSVSTRRSAAASRRSTACLKDSRGVGMGTFSLWFRIRILRTVA